MIRTVVLPDVHVDNQNVEAISPVLQFIKYYRPNRLIQLGDLCNFDSISKYEAKNALALRNTVTEEVKKTNEFIDKLEAHLPKKCEKYLTGGNHEARYPAFKVNHGHKTEISMLYKFTSWQEEYNLEKRKWKSCEYGQWFEIGRIIYTHGWYVSGSHAKRHLHLFHKNIVYGHSHEWQVSTGTGIDNLPIMSASIGTLSRFDLTYLSGRPPVNWCNMFMWIDELPNGQFTPHFTTIINGKFIELQKQFGGEKDANSV